MMIATLLATMLAALPQEKTVEGRLKELEEKLGSLEKRHTALREENVALEKRAADAQAVRETYAKQAAAGWVKRYAKPVELTDAQSAELEALWLGWTKQDFEKAADLAGWKAREEALKGKLAADQVPKLARAVRDEQEKYAKMSIASFVQSSKIAPERAPAFEKAVLAKLTFKEGALLTQAHPEAQVGWFIVHAAVDQALPDLAPVLSEEEQVRLRETILKWSPRR